jgi:hypothetical protein
MQYFHDFNNTKLIFYEKCHIFSKDAKKNIDIWIKIMVGWVIYIICWSLTLNMNATMQELELIYGIGFTLFFKNFKQQYL